MSRVKVSAYGDFELYQRASRIYENGSKGMSVPEIMDFIVEWEEITGKFKK